jgi:predicted ATPase/class 3 adenylate cyclase
MDPRGGDRVGEASVDIAAWLHGLGLQQYEQVFRENAIDDAVLPELTADDLKDLGVSLVGHRRKLVAAIAALRRESGSEPREEAGDVTDTSIAERRHLTIMFSDLVGSTGLSTRYDPEDLREIVGAYHSCVADTVARFDGFVAKYMGDGVLVYFGYPNAHEDDAERAVRAGLAVIDAAGRLDIPERLQVRLGVASGLAVVGDLIGAGAAQERGVVGETPNLAARLQALAAPGTLVISEATRRQIGAWFEMEDLGPQPLAGFAEPQRAWRVAGESAVVSRFEALRGEVLTPFVARDEEIELLLRRWQRAIAGEGQMVLLSGEAGIGKSRLVSVLHDRLSGEAHTRLRYFCSPHHQDSALHPFIAQLERAAGFAREDTVETRLDKLQALVAPASPSIEDLALLAELLSLPAELRYPQLTLSPQAKKERTFVALLRQLEWLTARQPVLFICEDLHWIDPSSRELLDRTIERAASLPVLLVVTFRPEFVPPWSGLPQVTTMTLARFDRRAGAAMVKQIAGGEALPAEVAAEIVERADGVPLFVEELTKAVIETGASEGVEKTLADALSPSTAVPSALHGPLMARLDRLGSGPKEVAQIAAAIGREFSYQLLTATAAPRGENDLAVALGRLGDAGLVFARGAPPEATYLFKHALVRDAAYASLLRRRRGELHARIAAALETDFPDIVEAQPERVAQHYTEAGLAAQAIAYWQRAGERAAARSANPEAISHFTTGIELLKSLPETPEHTQQALTLYTALGAALVTAKGLGAPEVEHAYTQAHALCQKVGETPELVPVLFGLHRFYVGRLQLHTAREIDETLLRLAQRAEDPALAVIAHYALGMTSLFLGALPAARLHLEEAIARYAPDQRRALVFRIGQDPGITCRMHAALLLWLLGYPEQAQARLHEALALAHELPHPYSLAQARCWAAYVYQFRWDVPAVHEQAEAAAALSIEQGFQFWAAAGTILRGWALAMQGQGQAGMAEVCQGIAAYRATEASLLLAYYCTLLAEVSAHLGHPEDGLQALVEAHTLMEQQEERYWEAEVCRLRGVLLLRQPGASQAEAEAWVQRALDVARRQEAKSLELRAAMSLARLWQQQGKSRKASALLAPIYDWFTEGFDTADLQEAKALLEALG